MQDAAQHHAAIRAGHHAALYRLLLAGAASERLLPPGTEGAIGRAQACYADDRKASALLREMNIAAFRLRQSLLAGDDEDCRAQHALLGRLADEWLYYAPLHHVAELLPPEGMA